jgi:hypothetical protein
LVPACFTVNPAAPTEAAYFCGVEVGLFVFPLRNFAVANKTNGGYTESAAQAELPKMDQGTFQEGYAAGWRSVAGGSPINIPQSPMRNDADAFMVGFSRTERDADPMACDAVVPK